MHTPIRLVPSATVAWVLGVTISWFGSAAVPDEGNTAGTCPAAGNCCIAHGTPGCDNTACCEDVCFIDDFCCTEEWNEACAGFAELLCESVCPHGDCFTEGDCCTPHGSAGCEDPTCCAAVCLLEEFCCTSEWDAKCAALARTVCGAVCGAPEGCPGAGDCCDPHLSAGCNDAGCCETVCAVSSTCCTTVWSEDCARTANLLCGTEVGAFCEWCPGTSSCCEVHLSPGCNREACCTTVCDADLDCCTQSWTLGCRRLADDLCANTVCVCDALGDFDADGAVDLSDFRRFQNCFTGRSGGPIFASCACADFDGDGGVDLTDYNAFHAELQSSK